MVLGQHRRMWLEAMRQTEQRVYGFGSLKDGYALVGIHLRKQKCCLKKGTTSRLNSIDHLLRIFILYRSYTLNKIFVTIDEKLHTHKAFQYLSRIHFSVDLPYKSCSCQAGHSKLCCVLHAFLEYQI